MTAPANVYYTARIRTTGGREGGASRSDDGRLDVKMSPPGGPGTGTNPEQLFAAGWSTCFLSAIKLVAGKTRVAIPADLAVDAEVDLASTHGVYGFRARLNVHIPGVERRIAEALAAGAHQVCPYSLATRDRIPVEINIVQDDAVAR